MRMPSQVAEQIREVVPEEHQERFSRLISDFSYKAPELLGYCWEKLSNLCNELIPCGIVEDWQAEMIAILIDRQEVG